ncbi:MAG: glycosyltransferase family 2 protein [Paramuribaculum sp.]|nr:glycosyltransferase family 2 protein [Paramuribaculum sp.]
MNAQVSVIILNWNGEKLLKRFLPSVARFLPESARLVVADNGSTDSSIAYINKEYPQIRIIAFEKNYGFAEGYNKAINLVDTPYCVLLNSDVEVKNDWVTPLLDYMETHPEVGAAQPKILSADNPDKFEHAGACGGFLDRHGYPYCRGRIFDTVESDDGQYDTPMSVFWASGAAMMVRTEVYRRAGGLDKEFFAHMEEIDLCWRIRLLGYDIAVVPQSQVYHLGGGSLPAENPKKTYLNFRNNLLMLHKNSPDSIRRSRLFVRRLLDTIAWLKFLLVLDFKNASAVIGAHRDFADMRKLYNNHPQEDILKVSPNKPISILWQYFVRRKKNFNRI